MTEHGPIEADKLGPVWWPVVEKMGRVPVILELEQVLPIPWQNSQRRHRHHQLLGERHHWEGHLFHQHQVART